jgi:hypothetical protein
MMNKSLEQDDLRKEAERRLEQELRTRNDTSVEE